MPRPPRITAGGLVRHAWNRANDRRTVFRSAGDYRAFEQVLREGLERFDTIRLLSFCLMPTHWHLLLLPELDGVLSLFMRWITQTHAQRYQAFYGKVGSGHLYQARYKSSIVQADGHLLAVWRYIERNPLRAGLVERAEEWRWCSLWRRLNGKTRGMLSRGPIELPEDWVEWVNSEETDRQRDAIRRSVQTNRPFGDPEWISRFK